MSKSRGKDIALKLHLKKKLNRYKNIQQKLLAHIKQQENGHSGNDLRNRIVELEDNNNELKALLESEKKVTEELERELLESSKPNDNVNKDKESLIEDIEVKSAIIEEQQEEIDILAIELEQKEGSVAELKEQMRGIQEVIKKMKESHLEEIDRISSPRTSLSDRDSLNPNIQKIKRREDSRRRTLQEEQLLNELDLSFDESESQKQPLSRPTKTTLITRSDDKAVVINPVLPSISSLTLAQDASPVEQGLHQRINILETELKKMKMERENVEGKHREALQRKDMEQAAVEKQLMKARDERVMTQLKLEKIKEIQLKQQQIMANIIEKEKNQLARTHKKVFKRGIMTLKEIQKQIVDENADLKKSNFVLMKRLTEVREIEGNIRFMKVSLSEKEERVNVLNENLRKKDLLIKHENCGFLRKEGGRIKNLKWRWFTFDNNGFSYFKEKGDKKPLGRVGREEGKDFKILKKVEGGSEMMFGIFAPDSRLYRCEAASASEKTRWLIFLDDWEKIVNSQ